MSQSKHFLTRSFSILTVLLLFLFLAKNAFAGQDFTTVMVRFNRLTAATATTGTVCATTSSATQTENYVKVTFPTGFTLGAYTTFGVGVTNTSWPSGATAWTGITAPTGAGDITGQTVKFASGDLTASTLYCFNWTSSTAVTTPSAANDLSGTVTTYNVGNTSLDTSNYATSIITSDQIAVTATVPATFTFTLSANASDFGTLSTGSVGTGSTVSVGFSTNAATGVIGWVTSTNGNLTSPSTSATITSPGSANATPDTLSAGTSGYVLDVNTNTNGTSGTGTVTIDAEFNGGANAGGHLNTNSVQTIFTTSGTHVAALVDLQPRAAISAIQAAAADYADTLTVVAAGRF